MKLCFKTILFSGVSLLVAASSAQANLLTNGDFATDLSSWTATPSAPTTIAYDGSEGIPSGSAKLDRVDSTNSSNGNYLWQAVPVSNGAQYKLDADWKGDLLNGGSGRNWAEVAVEFNNTGVLTEPIDTNIQYKVATDGGNDVYSHPFDWTSILTAPSSGPADGIFTATGDFMIVAFNIGGRDVTRNNTQPGFYWVDNASITRIPEPATIALLGMSTCGLLFRRRHS
ncbi:PEP-CTERM sorting domain-containing protein [Bythopirellula polymerisocia]|uniref:Uncharacterized protein n=1 Tax=Bythopirellula polymerisocia TaxID=2528003 RepID=A0A5C6CZG0_9BACT|nr:PEP-CTERM sorting domain-containing protein [Bythopirellula polymerisocia]TWU29980.1 hypothetical protein Pla144_07610 [Bythopirellula polymerisocia]